MTEGAAETGGERSLGYPGWRVVLASMVALAFGPPSLIDEVLARPLRAWNAHTLTDPEAIRAEVARVRRQGWATAIDAVQLGVNALAAPVFDHRGEVRGAVALVGADDPAERRLGGHRDRGVDQPGVDIFAAPDPRI